MKAVLGVLLLVPAFSFAGGDYSAVYMRCLEGSEGVTVAILDCNQSEIEHQDARLNNAYKSAMKRLSVKDKTALRDAQRAWIKYRDKRVAATAGDGTMLAVEQSSVFLEETARRAEELELLRK